MSRRALRTNAVVGLVLAVVSNLFLATAFVGNGGYAALGGGADFINALLIPASAGAILLGPAAAVLAAIVLTGPNPTRRLYRWLIPILIAVAAIFAWFEIGGGIVSSQVSDMMDTPPDPSVYYTPVIAFVLYLIAATLYGFAGQAQGVKVGARTGLLVLLLLAVIPIVNIVGLIGFLVTSITRKPA